MFDQEYLDRMPEDLRIVKRDVFKFLRKKFHPSFLKEDLVIELQCFLWAFKSYEIPEDLAYKLINEWLKKNNKESMKQSNKSFEQKALEKRPKEISIIQKDIFTFLNEQFHSFYTKEKLILHLQNELWAFKGYRIPNELAHRLIDEWLKKNNKNLKR